MVIKSVFNCLIQAYGLKIKLVKGKVELMQKYKNKRDESNFTVNCFWSHALDNKMKINK